MNVIKYILFVFNLIFAVSTEHWQRRLPEGGAA